MRPEKGIFFRKFLNTELKNRCLKNPSYSLRSFAKHLSYDASNLCKYMNGSIQISEKFYLNVKNKLGLPQDSLEQFERENALLYTDNNVFHLSEDNVSILGGAQCLILLEVLHLSHLEKTTSAIAEYLNLPALVIENTLNFLTHLNIVNLENGIWKHTGQIVKLRLLPKKDDDNDFAYSIARNISSQLLQNLAINHSERIFNWSLVATDSKLLPEATKKLAGYREEILSFLESAEDKNTVFSYMVGLYPAITSLTKNE